MKIKFQKLEYELLFTHLISTSKEFENKSIEFYKEYAQKLIRYANFAVCYDESEKSILGFIAFYANMVPNAYITHVYVSNPLRGKGICGQLLKSIEELCTINKFDNIKLEVLENNFSALKAYEKFGFKKILMNQNKILMKKELSI